MSIPQAIPEERIEERAAQFGILPIVTEEPGVSRVSVVRMSWQTDVGPTRISFSLTTRCSRHGRDGWTDALKCDI